MLNVLYSCFFQVNKMFDIVDLMKNQARKLISLFHAY